MDIPNDSPTTEMTCQGVTLVVPQPFKDGHVCKGKEHEVLNQTLKENLRNNFAGDVKEELEKAKNEGREPNVKALQDTLNERIKSYEFNVNVGGIRSGDPVKSRAIAIAKELVKTNLRSKNIKLKDVPTDQINQAAEALLERFPEILKQAEAQHKATQKLAGVVME